MKMCCLGGKNSVVKGLRANTHAEYNINDISKNYINHLSSYITAHNSFALLHHSPIGECVRPEHQLAQSVLLED